MMSRRFSVSSGPSLDEIRHGGIGLAAKLVLERKCGEARQVLMKVLEICPDDMEIMNLLAETYLVEDKIGEAKTWLDRVFLIDPDNPRALYNMGVVHKETGEYEKAIAMYEMAIRSYPEDKKEDIADAWQNLGCALWEARRRNEALEAWKTCLKYNPKQKYAKRNLKEFTNEYGMPKSPVGKLMDDYWAFTDMKQKEYLSMVGKESIDDIEQANAVLKKISEAWNEHIASKYGRKLDRMKTEEKIKLFNKVKLFE
ncbi:MAG: tetratricopeptide repeat protein [Candidatus Methanoperedens sp.]|nr:tetratricopeptide repeat protein [Candidatus Methanoperedens sp.]